MVLLKTWGACTMHTTFVLLSNISGTVLGSPFGRRTLYFTRISEKGKPIKHGNVWSVWSTPKLVHLPTTGLPLESTSLSLSNGELDDIFWNLRFWRELKECVITEHSSWIDLKLHKQNAQKCNNKIWESLNFSNTHGRSHLELSCDFSNSMLFFPPAIEGFFENFPPNILCNP